MRSLAGPFKNNGGSSLEKLVLLLVISDDEVIVKRVLAIFLVLRFSIIRGDSTNYGFSHSKPL